MKRYKHSKEEKSTDRVAFYVALSVCMMAVGLAVWSAYESFNDYMDESDGTYFSSLSTATAAVDKNLTGVTQPGTEAATEAATQPNTAAAAASPTVEPKLNSRWNAPLSS